MFLKLILRRLNQSKGLALINIFGLMIALCSTIFLAFYIVQELSYDKHIPNHEKIYRLLSIWHEGNKTEILPINLNESILQLKDNIPEVEEVTQIYRGGDSYFKLDDHVIANNPTFQVTPNFLKVFKLKPIYGLIDGALDSPNKIVISKKAAQKVFGNRNPVGKEVVVDEKLFTVSAVIENVPDNTHFYFDVLKPISSNVAQYRGLEFFTYILFKKDSDLPEATKKCEDHVINVLGERFKSYDFIADARLEPIADIHLYTVADFDFKENGNITLIIFLIVLAITILIISITNYINLFSARKENFIKHVSIQKVLGSNLKQSIFLFFNESAIVIVSSFILALFLFLLVKSHIANYIGINFIINLWQTPSVYVLLICTLIFTLLIAGLVPALNLGRICNLSLRHPGRPESYRKHGKKYLLVFQFSLISFMLIGILTIHTQISYIESKPKGFSSENVINYKRITNKLTDKWHTVANELRSIPHVVEVTGSHSYPGTGGSGQGVSYNGSPMFSINEARVQSGYLEVFGLKLAEGRFFNNQNLEKNAVILNQRAVRELSIKNPVGKFLHFDNGYTDDGKVQIIGVVNDYNYHSLKSKIAPLMLTNYRNDIYTISIKTDGSDDQEIIKQTNKILKKFDPNYRIVFTHFDKELSYMYATEHALRRIFYLGTFLGILVALVGLLAFAALMIELRTKEIGIRKVNGAKVSEILAMLNKDFVKWVAIAFVVACPIAYYAMNKWLENFAYKTTLSWWIFALAGVLALGIALLTVSWQSWRAATRNPVEALRYE